MNENQHKQQKAEEPQKLQVLAITDTYKIPKFKIFKEININLEISA